MLKCTLRYATSYKPKTQEPLFTICPLTALAFIGLHTHIVAQTGQQVKARLVMRYTFNNSLVANSSAANTLSGPANFTADMGGVASGASLTDGATSRLGIKTLSTGGDFALACYTKSAVLPAKGKLQAILSMEVLPSLFFKGLMVIAVLVLNSKLMALRSHLLAIYRPQTILVSGAI